MGLPSDIKRTPGIDKGPEQVQRLAEELADAFHTEGFFYIINHGISEEGEADVDKALDKHSRSAGD